MNWKTINDTVEDRTMIKTHKCMKTGMPPMKYNKLTENRNQTQIENNMITDQQTRAGEKYNKIPNCIRKLPINKFKKNYIKFTKDPNFRPIIKLTTM